MENEDRVVAENIERVDPVVPMFRSEMLAVVLTGLGVGLLVSGATYLLNRFVFSAVMCASPDAAECAHAYDYSMIVAMVIGAIAGLIALVHTRIYRPLLVVIAASVSLWGLHTIVEDLAWYWALGITMVLFALTYALFMWLARIRSFVIAAIACVALVALIRLVFTL